MTRRTFCPTGRFSVRSSFLSENQPMMHESIPSVRCAKHHMRRGDADVKLRVIVPADAGGNRFFQIGGLFAKDDESGNVCGEAVHAHALKTLSDFGDDRAAVGDDKAPRLNVAGRRTQASRFENGGKIIAADGTVAVIAAALSCADKINKTHEAKKPPKAAAQCVSAAWE